MDALPNKLKGLVFFLATALLSTAPVNATVLATDISAVTLGSAACNSFQVVSVAGSDAAVQFTAAIQYNTGEGFGNWLFVKQYPDGSSTSTSTPITLNTGVAGLQIKIGLNYSPGLNVDTANVILTPTNSSINTITIPITYQQNISCNGSGSGVTNTFITVTPGSVSLAAAPGGQQSQNVTVQNNTSVALTYSVSAASTGWLSANASNIGIPAGGSTTLNVKGDATQITSIQQLNGTLTFTSSLGGQQVGGQLTVPVTLNVSNSGGGGSNGTLTLNGATNNTATLSFTETEPDLPGSQFMPIQDSASGANYYTYSVTTSAGGNWLLADYNTSGTTPANLSASAGSAVNISLSNVAKSLPAGAYQGNVSLTSSSGSTANIIVDLYVSTGAGPGITVTPSLVYVFPNVAVGSTNIQQQTFTVSAAAGYSVGIASINPGASINGLTMSTPVISGITESFTVTANPASQAAGAYSAQITIPSSGNQAGTTTVVVGFPIGQGATSGGGTGGSGTTLIQPTTLNFQQQQNNSFWTGQGEGQLVTFTGQQGTQWNASIIYGPGGSNWLAFDAPTAGAVTSGTFGSGPSTITVDLFNGVGNLVPSINPYTATVNITTTNGTYAVTVNVLVTQATDPVLLGKPASITFSSSNGSTPTNQVSTIVGSDNTSSTTNPVITAGTPSVSWATVSTSGNTMTVAVNPTGQATGIYSGTVPITAAGYNHSLNYPLVLVVNGGGGGSGSGPLNLSSTSLSFPNVTTQITQLLNVTATNSTNVQVSTAESTCQGSNWLSINSSSFIAGQANTALTVTITPGGIASGTTCQGTISLATSAGTQTVPVSMTVGGSTGGGNVTVTPTTMNFTFTQNQTVPAAQTATIVNAATSTSPIPFTVTTAVSGTSTNWLQTSVTSGQTPFNNPGLSVSVAPGSLNAGTYNGTVTIQPTGGAAQVINVSLQVNANPVVTATPTTLNLSYIVGGTSPTGGIQVSAGGAAAGFTATANSTGWLKVSPTSGTTPNTGTFNLSASLDPTALAALLPGNYSGSITVAGTSPATGTTMITVNLSITAPLPTITSVSNSASGSSAGVAPGELISIYANPSNPIGPTPAVQLDGTTCPNGCTKFPLTLGGVTVTFLPSGVTAPLSYVSATQVNAIVPYSIVNVANLSVQIKFLGQTSNAFPLQSVALNPGIFIFGGTTQAAANMYDTTGAYRGVNSAGNPAQKGWLISLFLTGEGLTNPASVTGAVTVPQSTTPPTPLPFQVPSVTIDNQPATLGGYGEAAGLVAGVLQVNFFIPQNVHSGPDVVQVTMGTASTQSNVTVYVQ